MNAFQNSFSFKSSICWRQIISIRGGYFQVKIWIFFHINIGNSCSDYGTENEVQYWKNITGNVLADTVLNR